MDEDESSPDLTTKTDPSSSHRAGGAEQQQQPQQPQQTLPRDKQVVTINQRDVRRRCDPGLCLQNGWLRPAISQYKSFVSPSLLANPALESKHCWQNYVDYYKCINVRGEEFQPCRQFFQAYNALCPNEWIDRWNTQREGGTFPADLTG